MGVTAYYMQGYVTKRQRLKRHYATIAAIVSAIGSAIGGSTAAGAATGAAAGLGSAAAGAGGASLAGAAGASMAPSLAGGLGATLGGLGSGTAGSAIGTGALGSAGTAALGGAIPEGISMVGPEAALALSESSTMLPAGLPPSFGGVPTGAPPAAAGNSFSSMLSSGLDFMNNPGGNIGGQVGKMFGNEKLGNQLGTATQAIMKGNEKPQQQGVPMPAQALSIAAPQAPPMPGMGSAMGGSGPSFHFNPQTGTMEYS